MNLEFRLIEMEKREPWMIAAMDHAIFEECEAGRSPPTLVFHNWERSVSVASGQSLTDLNMDACKREGYAVVRMKTGGKAVVHFPDSEFSYSLFIPSDALGRDPTKLYQEYCGKVASALESFDLPGVVVKKNDVFVGKQKIGGNAIHMRLQSGAAMQQGVILYEKPDAQIMLSLMSPSLYPASAVGELDRLLTGFRSYSTASMQDLQQELVHQLTQGRFRVGSLTEREMARVYELQEGYMNPSIGNTGLVHGLCWLPAPEYVARKQRQEVRQGAQA
jgi:lipoate-protein ligase A